MRTRNAELGHIATLLLTLASFATVSCGNSNDRTANAEDGASTVVLALSNSDATKVTVTISAADITSAISVLLTKSDSQWSGTIGAIPAGNNRIFTLSALDVNGIEIYHGEVAGVSVTKGQTVTVVINAQQVSPSFPHKNSAPVIDALVASGAAVAPGGVVDLSATAHDADPGDSITYAWTTSPSAGVFSNAALAATTWTAPAMSGTYKLNLDVRDTKGASAKMSINITVGEGNGKGRASMVIHLNTSPVVDNVTADSTRIDVGASTVLNAVVADSDGDALTFAWSSDCSGNFSSSTDISPTFTLAAIPTSNYCTLSVLVNDGKGGTNTGSITIATGPAPTVDWKPEVQSTFQSSEAASPGETVTLSLGAQDPNGTPVTFAWAAASGTLGTVKSAANSSEVVWTAPATFAADAMIQVTITDATAQVTVQSFMVQPMTIVGPGQFTSSGTLATARAHHTATLLSSGDVLVAGGDSGPSDWSQAQASAELYNATTGTFSATGSLVTRRALHTATVLPNGKILVAGGNVGQRPFGSEAYAQPAELYDPATGVFTATGSLLRGRYGHTSTLLQNGKVLIVGGYYVTGTAELYDPATGTFTSTGGLAAARFAHTATLLGNGKVLVAGGELFSGAATASTELYDPVTGTFSNGSSMLAERFSHSATRLPDGKVAFMGGSDGAGGTRASIEIYDPVAGTFVAAGSLMTARVNQMATVMPDGRVLVVGGTQPDGITVLTNNELYEPTSHTSVATGALPTAGYSATATLLNNGKVLVMGGWGGSSFLASSALYY